MSSFDTSGTGGAGDSTRIAVVELFDSRTVSADESGRRRGRKFIVYARSGSRTTIPTSTAAISELGITYGDPHPEDSGVRAIEFSVRPADRMGQQGWIIDVGYRPIELTNGGALPPGPSEPDFQEVNLAGEATFIDAWRTGVPLPSSGDPGPGDIGGTKIDVAGQPQQVLLRVGRYEIVRNYRLSAYFAEQYLAAIGRRNNGNFLGFPAGSLLYAPPRATRVAVGIVRVVHSLIVDEFYHLRQKPRLDENGVVLGEDGHAETVEWFQPFPNLINFASLNMIAPDTPVPGG